MIALLLTVFACVSEDPCLDMCSTITQHLGGCIEGAAISWDDMGYADARDFFHSCETWAWSTRKIETEEGPQGATEQICDEWNEHISNEAFECSDLELLDWDSLPW